MGFIDSASTETLRRLRRATGPVVFAILATACSGDKGTAPPLPRETAEHAGMTSAGLERIRPAMQRYVDEGEMSALVSIVAREGRLVHWEAVGFRDLESMTPVEPDDIFRICSMTKPITSVATMLLVEDGAIALEDPVGDYLPELKGLKVYTDDGLVPPETPVTIEHLLSHTSGLSYGHFGDGPVDAAYMREDVFSGDLANLVTEVGGIPLMGEPGQVWNYGVSTDVLGRLIEVVSGQSLDRFMEERIFVPLKMPDTGFRVDPATQSRLVTLYRPNEDGSLTPTTESLCSDPFNPTLLSGGGGLLSTAADYLRFSQMLLNGGILDGVRLLEEPTVERMRTNLLPPERIPIQVGPHFAPPGYGFGLGFGVLTDAEATPIPDSDGVFRWQGYASTYFWIDPQEQLIGIVLGQLEPGIHPEIEVEFQTLVYEARFVHPPSTTRSD